MINLLENRVTKIHIDGKDVYLTVENDDDVFLPLTISAATLFILSRSKTLAEALILYLTLLQIFALSEIFPAVLNFPIILRLLLFLSLFCLHIKL